MGNYLPVNHFPIHYSSGHGDYYGIKSAEVTYSLKPCFKT